MMIAPVSLCMIVKNESSTLEKCLKSIRPYVEEICIVDTGSDDGTQDIAKQFADKFEVFLGCNGSDGLIEDFSLARQRSFSLASKEWVLWIDGDDEIRGADKLAELIAQKDAERAGRPYLIMFQYEYSKDADGNIDCLHWRERLGTPTKSFKWVSPVHEVLSPEISGTPIVKDYSLVITHCRNQSRKVIEPNRNLRILKKHYDKVGEADIRLLYYLGLEYGNARDFGNSIKFHKRYIELSGWDEERFLACLKIAEHYQTQGQYEDAIQWGLKSLTIREGWGEGYFNLGRSYYFMAQRGGPDARRNWEKSIYFFNQGLSCAPTESVLFVNPTERTYNVNQYLNVAFNNVGNTTSALNSVNIALQVRSKDEGLLQNKRLYEIHLSKLAISEHLRKLVQHGCINTTSESMVKNIVSGELKLETIPDKLTPSIIDIPVDDSVLVANDTTSVSIESINCNKFDIILYTGFGCEPWNPETIATKGNGGSEYMAMAMMKRLANLGHKVRLYGDCRNLEGIFEGVEYVHYEKFRNTKCDVLITSRRPQVVDDEFNIETKTTLCWVHDIALGSALDHSRSLRINKFLCLSQWQKDFFLNQYKFIHPDQIILTRNGIDLHYFDQTLSDGSPFIRNPHRAVYSSSPDRGMEVLVRLWPCLRERVPDAELHIFYGFNNWEIAARSMNDKGQLNLINTLKKLLDDSKQYGVFFYGRTDQPRLAREYLQSGVWPYSTWFTETSCLSAMEAQAAGLRIITSPIAALNETVGSRGVMITGDWLSADYSSKFLDAMTDAMLRPEVPGERESLKDYAKANFGLDALAKEWSDKIIPEALISAERDIIPPYRSLI